MRAIFFSLISLFGINASSTITYNVIVDNESKYPIDVYIFTEPAIFSSSSGTYTNSLGSQIVQPLRQSQARFTIENTFYAAAQLFDNPTGELQSTSVALRPIAIKTDSQPAQRTMLSFDPNNEPVLGDPTTVTAPDGSPAIAVEGTFQIQTPVYPDGQGDYGIGLGLITNGLYNLATYTMARPNQFVDVQPVEMFFIAIGRVEKGVDANFYSVSTSSALCDATDGTTTFHVVRTKMGKWKVNGKVQNVAAGGRPGGCAQPSL